MSKEVLVCGFDDVKDIVSSVSKLTNSSHSIISVSSFPDGELLVRFNDNPNGKKVVIISSMSKNPDSRIIETLLACSAARDNGAKEVILFATYFPYLRQDKSFHDFECVSAKEVMSLFSSRFDKIVVVDPHLHRINSLKEYSKKASEVSSISVITDYLKSFKDDFVLVGPDEESDQWAKKIAKDLGKEVHILIKNRKDSEHVKESAEGFSLKGKNVVIVDDIISTGHTLSESLKLVKAKGVKNITCIGVHGILAENAVKLITKYAKLITTNTIPSKFSRIDVSPLIVDFIKKL